METIKYDVFLSRKSEDSHLSKEIYEFLTEKGLKVFDSDHSLQEMGNADYSEAIDEALINSNHLIVVSSSINNINSSWVKAEWRFFLNRKRSGKTNGNLLTVITEKDIIDRLPPSLQNYEAIFFSKNNFERIEAYVKPLEGRKSLPANIPVYDQITTGTIPIEKEIRLNKEKEGNEKNNLIESETVKSYRKAAEQGKADAQFYLGLAYDNGVGVVQNDLEAVKWYSKAAEQGYAAAQNSLGKMYRFGRIVKKDKKKSFQLYRKAAEQGYVEAQHSLGVLYSNGEGTERDNIEAVKWFKKAAKQGLDIAQYSLGFSYEHGDGIEQNLANAILWYQLAARQGYIWAKDKLKCLNQTW
ncbi:MAG: toll/interleukin-1 receptor domain-containing protein [Arcicella sp.]|jgi:hypothetical protein|nr:toll/interleukin-1 receptor domain-containing protein [Arcicella sp.]